LEILSCVMNMAANHSRYDKSFFDSVTATSNESAAQIIPWVVKTARPSSVLDVGCGEGAWLAAFRAQGINDLVGVDGRYVDQTRLKITPEQFQVADLAQPLSLGRTFDLAICLEVAEHLPLESAETIIRSVTQHAQVALFSAAIPFQDGTDHINEQWPSYWIQKMAERGFRLFDVIRPQFWNDAQVAFWYRQNLMIFMREEGEYAGRFADAVCAMPSFQGLALVHPEQWNQHNGAMAYRVGRFAGPRALLSTLPKAIARAFLARLPESSRVASS
jgi:SAM-dependent methyltransferase